MSSQAPGHGDLGPELRQVATLILERLDPAVRSLAALAASRAGDEPGPCQQVWCPLCAVAALASGTEHPLLAVVSEHGVNLLTVLRGLLDEPAPAAAGDDAPAPPEPPSGNGRYQHIPINVEE